MEFQTTAASGFVWRAFPAFSKIVLPESEMELIQFSYYLDRISLIFSDSDKHITEHSTSLLPLLTKEKTFLNEPYAFIVVAKIPEIHIYLKDKLPLITLIEKLLND